MIIDMSNARYWENQQGTGDIAPCSCGSWKQHWENYSRTGIAVPKIIRSINPQTIWPAECSVVRCSEEPILGAHVINPCFDSGEQIVPMCNSCNGKSQSFNLKIGTRCVSANVANTCGK